MKEHCLSDGEGHILPCSYIFLVLCLSNVCVYVYILPLKEE